MSGAEKKEESLRHILLTRTCGLGEVRMGQILHIVANMSRFGLKMITWMPKMLPKTMDVHVF